MAHKRDPKLPVVGEDSLCLNCAHSRIVTCRAELHPAQAHQFMQENPGKELPPNVYHVESLCTHIDFVGRGSTGHGIMPARDMGTVVECENFESRGIPTREKI